MNVSRHLRILKNLQLNAFIKSPLEGIELFPSKVLQETKGTVEKNENLVIRHNSLALVNVGKIQERPVKKIIDPLAPFKIEINIPISKIINNVNLPCIRNSEMIDPTKGIVEKKAHVLIRIRRRKMKKHRMKKWKKKFRAVLLIKKIEREKKEAKELKDYLEALDSKGSSFSVENYMESKLETYNWTPPKTRLFGRLAPEDVIKEHIKKKEIEAKINERINYSLNMQNLKK